MLIKIIIDFAADGKILVAVCSLINHSRYDFVLSRSFLNSDRCDVVLDPSLMLAIDVFPGEDGDAQERSLLPQVLATVESVHIIEALRVLGDVVVGYTSLLN